MMYTVIVQIALCINDGQCLVSAVNLNFSTKLTIIKFPDSYLGFACFEKDQKQP